MPSPPSPLHRAFRWVQSQSALKFLRTHLFVASALGLALACGVHTSLHHALVDLRFAWLTRPASGHIVLIAIDPHSIDKIGGWPWSRGVHAGLIDVLNQAGVDEIIFDVDFSAPSDAVSDATFENALKRSGSLVVLPTFHQAARADDPNANSVHVNQPLPSFAAHSWPALVNVWVESDGRVRRYPFGGRVDGKFFPSMGAVAAGTTSVGYTPFLIDFGIQKTSVPVLSYIDVLRGDADILKKLKGKKVVIGGTAIELGDRFSVPNGPVIAGPLLQILAAESIAQGRALSTTSGWVALFALLGLALTMMLTWRRLASPSRVLLLLALAAIVEATAFALQKIWPVVLDTSTFHLAAAGYLTAIAIDEIGLRGLLARIAEKRFQRITMSLGDAVVCTDPNFAITVWNPGAEAIFGYAADDIIGKPFDLLCANHPAFSIKNLTQAQLQSPGGKVVEFDGRTKLGEAIPLEACFSGWNGTDGFHYGASLRDISVRKREAEKIRYLAEHDTITALANRHTLKRELASSLARGETVSLLILSVNKFYQVNVLLGHSFGDLLLTATGKRLNEAVAGTGLLARVRGEEFAVLIEAGKEEAALLCQKCAAAFDRPLAVEDRQHRVSVRIGVAVQSSSATVEDVIGNAYLALYRAKLSSTEDFVFYDSSMRDELEQRLSMEAELLRAVERNEFELHYQPQASLQDRKVVGAEALIRWRHPTRGLLSPANFMPAVHASLVSLPIANWVLETACRQARAWERSGSPVRVGVNLSPAQFQADDLAGTVADVLDRTGLTPALLELEVTEDILLDDVERTLATFRAIQQLGVRLVFDDFGTGYGSLAYLKQFPLDGLKIDRSFVADLQGNRDDNAIVASTILLTQQLDLSVIAEGIEDAATADVLAEMGCQEGQGYFFGKPCPASIFERDFLATKGRPVLSDASERIVSAA